MGHNNFAALIAARLAGGLTRVVVCQHNSLAAETAPGRPLRFRVLPLLYRLTLPLADAVVAVSDGVAREMERLCKCPAGSILTIYNPAWSPRQASVAAAAARKFRRDPDAPALILGIGRLVAQKDFATLIAAFAIARDQGLHARLVILGDGPLRSALQAQINTLSMNAFCCLPGFTAQPLDLLTQADMLVMSSRYEGFGNVLVEALGCGTPVVTTDCPYGPAEIVDQGRFGEMIPVGDAPQMAAAIMRTAMASPDRAALRDRAEMFTLTRAVAAYAALFTRLCASPHPASGVRSPRQEYV
jgi:glycosyltransferase involved in cell wall biosynthesis